MTANSSVPATSARMRATITIPTMAGADTGLLRERAPSQRKEASPVPGGFRQSAFIFTDAGARTNRRRGSGLQAARYVLVLARELHARSERHRLHQGGEILLQVGGRLGLQHGGAEVALQHFAGRRRDRH